MTRINVDKMSLKELLTLDQAIKAAIGEARSKGRTELKNQVAELAAAHGFSISELFGGHTNGKMKSSGVAKYANPDDATDTWTGRGRKPNWLVAKLKKGADLSDFKI